MTHEAAPKSFFDEVKASVARFAQSAVVIDDEAYMVVYSQEMEHTALSDTPKIHLQDSPEAAALTPTSNALTSLSDPEYDLISSSGTTDLISKSEEVEKEAAQSVDHLVKHSLDARRIISAFAEHGIICGVINPVQGVDFASSTFKLAQKADFIVLDYKIHKSYDASLNFLEKVATEDVKNSRQRAMIIYTGEDGIDEIVSQVKRKLQGLHLGQPVVSIERRPTAMRIGSLVIDVVRKSKIEADYVEQEGGRLTEDRIPDYLIGLYAELAHGLLKTAVLEDLAIIREQMPRLANLFTADMDAAYLAHRALVDKDDAPGIVTTNLATAIENLLDSEEARHKLGKTLVQAWIMEKLNGEDSLTLKYDDSRNISFTKEELISLVETGLKELDLSFNSDAALKVSDEDKILLVPRITEIFTHDVQLARKSNALFAMTTSLSKRKDFSYVFDSNSPPYLQLGCIVEDLDSKKKHRYFLCIQPVCNSVRLSRSTDTRFPFLPFHTILPDTGDSSSSAFDLVVPDGNGDPIYLKEKFRPDIIQIVPFRAGVERKITSIQEADGSIIFHSAGSPKGRWRWVAQLKPAHAQRLVHIFATNLSRVGLDESEWLRQSAQGSWRLN